MRSVDSTVFGVEGAGSTAGSARSAPAPRFRDSGSVLRGLPRIRRTCAVPPHWLSQGQRKPAACRALAVAGETDAMSEDDAAPHPTLALSTKVEEDFVAPLAVGRGTRRSLESSG